MKIFPISCCCAKPLNINAINKKDVNYAENTSKVSAVVPYYVPFLGEVKYAYKPVSSKKPNYDLLNCDYENLDEFSRLYAQKINSQLLTIEKSDIEQLIARIKLKTNAPEELIKEVLYRLTLFSGYDSIDFFEELTKEYSTNIFGINPTNTWGLSDHSLNASLQYLSYHKQIFPKGRNEKSIVVLDNTLLEELQNEKNLDSIESKNIEYDIESGNVVFVNIPGWDIKCLDGKYRSANFLVGSGFLESVATDTLKRLSKGESIDDILYGDFETRLKQITGLENIQVYRKQPAIKTGSKTLDDIYENLKKPSLSDSDVKNVILSETRKIESKKQQRILRRALCKFLDEYSIVYSNDSMAVDLINLQKKLKQKFKNSKKQTLYCIWNFANSSSHITALYSYLNNIAPENVVTFFKAKTNNILSGYLDDKNAVFVDDNSSSGSSILGFESIVEGSNLASNWAVLLATRRALKNLKDDANPIPESVTYLRELGSLDRYINAADHDFGLLSQEERHLLWKNFFWGYEDSGTMCAFPHIIPDNCIDISAELFKKILIRSNYETNKPLDGYEYKTNGQQKGLSFKGKFSPISSATPNYNTLSCSYSDINVFSDAFSKKVNSQLRTITYGDFEALCQRLEAKTGASKDFILQALQQITLFSSYKTIDFLKMVVDENATYKFGVPQNILGQLCDLSSNAALNYLSVNKQMLLKHDLSCETSIVVLDGIFLDQLEYSKKHNTDYYRTFINKLNEGKINLVNLKGWDIQCSDKRYRSAAFLYGTGQLEELAYDVITRLQNGESVDSIFYKNIEKRFYEIVGDDIEKESVKIKRYSTDTKTSIGGNYVFQNIQRPELKPANVKIALRKLLSRYSYDFQHEHKKRAESLMKYLDEATLAYSFDSIGAELSDLYEKVCKLYGDNVLYLIAQPYKSIGLISHLYAKINNVPCDKFFNELPEKRYYNILEEQNCPTIILDDISASGKTVSQLEYSTLWKIRTRTNAPLSFALLVATDRSINVYNEHSDKSGQLLYAKKAKSLCDYKTGLLDSDALERLKMTISKGYMEIATSVVFPYLIPDNSSDISGEMFKHLLIKNNKRTNKAMVHKYTT